MYFRFLKVSLVLLFIFILFSDFAIAKPEGLKIHFQPQKLKVKFEKEETLKLLVKKAPKIYGMELNISFDPQFLEVTDANTKTKGIQLKQSEFFKGRNLVLQNTADNKTGTIGYAITLLNPAKAVSGNGELIEINFKGKKSGQTNLIIAKAQFGTRKGKVFVPDYEPELDVVVKKEPAPFNMTLPLIVIIILGVAGIIFFLIKRK